MYDLGRCQVILDLSACTYIGSAGLSLLVRFANSFRRWDRGDLYLAGVSPYIQGLLGIAGLATDESQFFRQYTSVEAALGSLPGDGRDDVR